LPALFLSLSSLYLFSYLSLYLSLSLSLFLSLSLSPRLSLSLFWDVKMILKVQKIILFCLGKRHNGAFLGSFRGGLDLFDTLEKSLEKPNDVFCPRKK
jgi:hypothetical protein